MIWIEAVAAALVGLALLAMVLTPLLSRHLPVSVPDDEPEELDETRRGAALLALKEIEFDRATGKLSDEDYATLKARYTAEALAALRDAESVGAVPAASSPPAGAEDVEVLVARRRGALAHGGAPGVVCEACGPRPEADAVFCSGCGRRLEAAGQQVVA